jgi:integrase
LILTLEMEGWDPMASLRKRGKTWYARYRDAHGKRIELGTGYRLGELCSLTPESFHLDDDPPTIFCEGEFTKNGKDATQPIRPELAEMLRPWLAEKPPGRPVFVLKKDTAAETTRLDLKAAGVASWEAFDFHSQRHSYITAVVKSGASVKVAMELARHSDPKLTMAVYSHLTVNDLSQGLEGLAHTLPTVAVSKGLTGTDGQVAISSPERSQVDTLRQPIPSPAPNRARPCQLAPAPASG